LGTLGKRRHEKKSKKTKDTSQIRERNGQYALPVDSPSQRRNSVKKKKRGKAGNGGWRWSTEGKGKKDGRL